MLKIVFLFVCIGVGAEENIRLYDRNQIIEIVVPKGYGEFFVEVCQKHKVPVLYAWKLIQWESRWDAEAEYVNKDGSKDIGLMQLNSRYLDDYKWRYNGGVPFNPYNWKHSISIGIHHLAVLYKHTGTWQGAIASYNLGLTRYRQVQGNLSPRMKEYITFILGEGVR